MNDTWHPGRAVRGNVEIQRVHVGTHICELHGADVFVLRVGGALEASDIHGIFDLFEQFAPGPAWAFFLVDLRFLGSVTPEARQVVGMRQLPPTYGGIAMFRGTFQQQLVAKLATTAGWLLRGRALGKPMPVAVKTEEEAWAWVSERRMDRR